MWIDICISAALAVLTIIMAYLGVHVTLHPVESAMAKKLYKIGFCLCAFGTVSLVVWQGIRNAQTQNALRFDVKEARDAAWHARDDVGQARQDLKSESTRREQAERDLALIVQATGRSTREGVVSDIKSSPIQVHVNGQIDQPLAVENIKLFSEAEKSTRADAPYAMKVILQADTSIPNVFLNISFNGELKYIESTVRDGALYYGGIYLLNADHKVVVVYVKSSGAAVLNTDSPIVLHVASANPIAIAKFLRAINQ